MYESQVIVSTEPQVQVKPKVSEINRKTTHKEEYEI